MSNRLQRDTSPPPIHAVRSSAFIDNFMGHTVPDSVNTNETHTLIQEIYAQQQKILERLSKIETILEDRLPPSNRSRNIQFPFLGHREQPETNSDSLTDEESSERTRKRQRTNQPPQSPGTFRVYSTTSAFGLDSMGPSAIPTQPETSFSLSRPRFSVPPRSTSRRRHSPTPLRPDTPISSTWYLHIKTDQLEYFFLHSNQSTSTQNSPPANTKENDYHILKTIEIQVTLPVQQLAIVPAIRVEVAKQFNIGWKDINLFLIKQSGLSQKDHLIGIQNHSNILVRKKTQEKKQISIRVILSTTASDFMKINIDQQDFIWEVKYQSMFPFSFFFILKIHTIPTSVKCNDAKILIVYFTYSLHIFFNLIKLLFQ